MYRIKCIEPEDTTIIYKYRFSMSNIHGVARKYGGVKNRINYPILESSPAFESSCRDTCHLLLRFQCF